MSELAEPFTVKAVLVASPAKGSDELVISVMPEPEVEKLMAL